VRVVAARLGENEKPLFVGLVPHREPDRTTVYWSPLGMTRCSQASSEVSVVVEYCTLENYESPTLADCEAVAKAEREYLEVYGPKPQPPCARLGWIAPNGDFYPCAYTAHGDLADQLSTLLGVEHYGGGERALEKAGWLALKGNACLGYDREEGISRDARDTFRRVVEEFELAEARDPDINWEEVITDNPEGYGLQFWASSPAETHGETYAKAMRGCYELYFEDVPTTPLGELKPPTFGVRVRRVGEHPGD
jgi:hypothetical protein